jgi:tRNA pseudouridine32 synthase/23S rRNA pseudouridine746 synthase
MTDAALSVLHQDENAVAVDKPAGVAVIAARGEPPAESLHKRLEAQLGERLFVVHRIDRDASGLVLFARHAQAHRALSLAFEHRRVHKTYVAVVCGVLHPPQGRLDVPLHPARKGKTRPARPGERGQQTATTDYSTRRVYYLGGEKISLVEARPVTGRHHQIRVHLRSADAPILFDPLYARGRTPAMLADGPCSRLALHAERLEVDAPGGDGQLVVESPIAADLQALLVWLDGHGSVPEERRA